MGKTERIGMKAEEYILRIPEFAKEKASQEEVWDFLKEMGEPQQYTKVIHIAGTNGKGTVSAFLTKILTDSGWSSATFTSPHLIKVSERFQINGREIDQNLYESCFETIQQLVDRMQKKGYRHPTFFEFLFYIQMEIVRRIQPDWLILETGMGGKRDVTNVFPKPFLTVLTSISMDHMQFLGETLPEIAREKAGIIKAGVPVVFDAQNPTQNKAVLNIIKNVSKEQDSCLYLVKDVDWKVQNMDYETGSMEAELFGCPCRIPFIAEYQAENAAVAFLSAKVLMEHVGEDWTEDVQKRVLGSIQTTRWQGRMEQVLSGVYLDGAHNEAGIHALTTAVRTMYDKTRKNMILLFAVAEDKEHEKMVKELCGAVPFSTIVAVHYESVRSAATELLYKEISQYANCPCECYQTTEEAFERALTIKEDGILIAAGSLYLIGELKALLQKRQPL